MIALIFERLNFSPVHQVDISASSYPSSVTVHHIHNLSEIGFNVDFSLCQSIVFSRQFDGSLKSEK